VGMQLHLHASTYDTDIRLPGKNVYCLKCWK